MDSYSYELYEILLHIVAVKTGPSGFIARRVLLG